jgi:hypothetical protein
MQHTYTQVGTTWDVYIPIEEERLMFKKVQAKRLISNHLKFPEETEADLKECEICPFL